MEQNRNSTVFSTDQAFPKKGKKKKQSIRRDLILSPYYTVVHNKSPTLTQVDRKLNAR